MLPPKLSQPYFCCPPLPIYNLVSYCLLNYCTYKVECYGQACHSGLMEFKGVWVQGQLETLVPVLAGHYSHLTLAMSFHLWSQGILI